MNYPYRHYSHTVIAIKSLLVVVVWVLMPSLKAAELTIDAGPGQLGQLAWQEVAASYRAGEQGGWQVELLGLSLIDGPELGDWSANCNASLDLVLPNCDQGGLSWRLGEHTALDADFSLLQQDGFWNLTMSADGWALELFLPEDDPGKFQASVRFDDFNLASLPVDWVKAAGLTVLEGRLSGELRWLADRSIQMDLGLDAVSLDTEEGLLAAEGLQIALELTVQNLQQDWTYSGHVRQRGGEILAGPLYLPQPQQPYLPQPQQPLEFEFSGQREGQEYWRLQRMTLTDPGALQLTGSALLELGEDGPELRTLELESMDIKMPLFWERWADGPAAQAGFGDLQTRGDLRGHASWNLEQGWSGSIRIDRMDLADPDGRLQLGALSGGLALRPEGLESDLSWQALAVYGLPFGPSRLRLGGKGNGVALLQPLELPLLDGAVVVDSLQWHRGEAEQPELRMDARIRPLSLTRLTRQLGWPEFGGQLSGEFPGIVYAEERLAFTGGIVVQAFSGTIELDELSIERPFGTLPALAAQVRITRLDLLELTGAFNFGRMEGQASGWMRDLRLLDWRPVRMDTRLFTHEDVPRRRISQRAVENLSSLGGAGGALISGTVLRVFEDFPYRRAGLACRLANNICHIDGVAPHESGGFFIVEGRALPRLDIIGHRRLVDWPQLVAQLEAMLE